MLYQRGRIECVFGDKIAEACPVSKIAQLQGAAEGRYSMIMRKRGKLVNVGERGGALYLVTIG